MTYPLVTATWDDKEYAALRRVIDSGNFTMGREVARFEQEFAKRFSMKHAVMSNSGSSANLLAMNAIRFSSYAPSKNRNQVIVPAVSWSTTYYPIVQAGFKLKFVDIDLNTLNASARSIETAIDDSTAGIFVVNLLGNPSELHEIRQIANHHGLFMLEDNCESMGASVDGKLAGTFADIGTFSSYVSHHISTMEGGLSVTDSEELQQVMTSLRAHGWTRELPAENYVHNKSGDPFDDLFRFVLPGFNLRPIEMEGALGSEQLLKLDGIVSGRRANAEVFLDLMDEFPEIITQKEHGESSWFGFSMVLSGKLSGRRPEFVSTLKQFNVEVRPIVAGNFTRNPVLKHLPHSPTDSLPGADAVHDDGLFVGNHHYKMVEEFDALRKAIKVFLG